MPVAWADPAGCRQVGWGAGRSPRLGHTLDPLAQEGLDIPGDEALRYPGDG